ncbi:MAG: hypothetical protein ACI311_03795 [Bacilli bacterium]
MNENELKNEIQMEADNYIIKTKSSTILNRFQEKQNNKNPFYRTNIFKFSTIGLSCAAVIITTTIVLNNQLKKNNQIPLNNKVLNMTTIEALAGISYLDSESTQNNRYSKRLSSISYKEDEDLTNTKFEQICDTFYTYVPMITNLSTYETYTPLNSDNKDFKYCLKFSSFYLYYNESIHNGKKTNIDGLIKKDNQTFDINITIKKEDDEMKTKMKIIESSTSYIEIEQEVETNENEYSLKHVKNDEVYEEINFEIEDDEKKLEVEISKGIELEYEYEILSTSSDQITFAVDTGDEELDEVILNLETLEFKTTFNNTIYLYKKEF